MTTLTALAPQSQSSRRAVGIWLLFVAALIVAMLAVGGLTRLTGSGLSITEWHPLMGAVPPMSGAAWHDEFAKYQRIPQYRLENHGMSLAGFKAIYWWEWSHRLLGTADRLCVSCAVSGFAATGAIARSEWPRMVLLFALGGLQGFVGWWMVESGLETRVSVSQYRLAIHLGVAIILLGAILWTALEYLRRAESRRAGARMRMGRSHLSGLVYIQMLLGALVAGLHAGLVYNTWPSMDGHVFPEHPFFSHRPGGVNFFDNPGLAQFDHRIGAYWWRSPRSRCGVWRGRRGSTALRGAAPMRC